MEEKEKYLEMIEKEMEKYNDKINNIHNILNKYNFEGKEEVSTESESLKSKFKQAQEIFKSLKVSTDENYEEVKASFTEIFQALKEAFGELSDLIEMKQLPHVKDNIIEFGNKKIAEVESYVKENPLTSTACAFAIGLFLGTFVLSAKS